MDQTTIQLAILDVDGTMVDSPSNRTLSPQLCQTIRQVAESGVRIGLASGRNYGHIMSQMRTIGFNGPIISNNGAYVVADGIAIYETLLEPDVIETVIRQAQELRYMVEFSGRETMYTYIPSGYNGPTFPKEGDTDYLVELDGTQADFDRMRKDHISKTTLVVDTREKAEAVTAFWTDGPMSEKATLSSSYWYCLELTAPGVSKGSALINTAAALGIPMHNVLAIGDGDNDAEMLEAAGISFAMANGSERSLLAAKYRAPHVKEDGARQVLQRYILRHEPLPSLKTN